MHKTSFYEQTSKNKRYSQILIILVFCVLVVFSYVIGRVFSPGSTLLFLIFGTLFSVGYIWYTYYNSDKIALSSVSAYPAEGPQFQQLRNVVEEMAIAGGMPSPRVYVMPSPDLNAFAAGRDPEHSVVCVTEGLIKTLNRQELQAVIAHELTHIRNYDIRFVTLVAAMVGLVSIVSQMFLRSLWWGSLTGGRQSRSRGGGNLAFLVLGVLLAVLAPFIVKLVQLAISRRREYMADAGGVELTRYPQGLVSALRKIKSGYSGGPKTRGNAAVAPLFIEDPIKNRLMSLFNTHPPIDERIKILESM
ncbi:MAG: M48 family metalloprotease [Candidatus Altiarchaeales archaeon]|nr:M48 family metalloprotease [Candidatus Altiarchaeales archaeon]